MKSANIAYVLDRMPGVVDAGMKLARALHRSVVEGGASARKLADLLHGTWLGHPLHPVLTDVTVGAWSLAGLYDVLARYRGVPGARHNADALTAVGLLSAMPTAVTGLMDFSAIKKNAASPGVLHALLNTLAFGLYAGSWLARRRQQRDRAEALSFLGLLALTGGAWVGGHLVYGEKVGVDHAARTRPGSWATVMDADELPEGQPTCVHLNGTPVLLFRSGHRVDAIGAVCSHAGGPLEEGSLVGERQIQCPWHQSIFDLRSGRIVHGPATHPQPAFEVRIREERIEIRPSSS